LYSYGRGVTRDDKQSVVWYRKAAEQGYERAQYNLGAAYFNGLGVAKDYRQAALWTEKSAEQGNIYAMYNLALSYSRGQGVEKDLVQSHKWFSLAAASGDKPAAKKRDELETQMTPEQIRQAQALAKEWKPRCK
jgi:TPR repeat protein